MTQSNGNLVFSCNLCENQATGVCPKCLKTFYCSKSCQIQDWFNSHKSECNSDPLTSSALIFKSKPKKFVTLFEKLTKEMMRVIQIKHDSLIKNIEQSIKGVKSEKGFFDKKFREEPTNRDKIYIISVLEKFKNTVEDISTVKIKEVDWKTAAENGFSAKSKSHGLNLVGIGSIFTGFIQYMVNSLMNTALNYFLVLYYFTKVNATEKEIRETSRDEQILNRELRKENILSDKSNEKINEIQHEIDEKIQKRVNLTKIRGSYEKIVNRFYGLVYNNLLFIINEINEKIKPLTDIIDIKSDLSNSALKKEAKLHRSILLAQLTYLDDVFISVYKHYYHIYKSKSIGIKMANLINQQAFVTTKKEKDQIQEKINKLNVKAVRLNKNSTKYKEKKILYDENMMNIAFYNQFQRVFLRFDSLITNKNTFKLYFNDYYNTFIQYVSSLDDESSKIKPDPIQKAKDLGTFLDNIKPNPKQKAK